MSVRIQTTLLTAVFALALAVSALLVVAPAAQAEERVCRGTIDGATVDNLRVPQGATCTLYGTRVEGTVKVERNATLTANGIRVKGNVQSEGFKNILLRQGSVVVGSVQLENGLRGGSGRVINTLINGSLQAQRIRGTTFEAFKEIPDALGENDPDARQEFETILEPVDRDFEVWRNLARTEEENRQVEQVREAHDVLVRDAYEFFDLLEAGRRGEASDLADGKIEEEDFESFQAATDQAVKSDRAIRDEVRARTEDTRRTAQLVLVIASFGMVSLLLLLAAYLAADLFRPLRDLEAALGDVGKGDLDRRLDEDRADELGGINRAFNRMVQSIARRDQAEQLAAFQGDRGDESAWRSTPSRRWI